MGCLTIDTFTPSLCSGVVWHLGKVLSDLGLLCSQPDVDGFRIDSPLVDGLEILSLSPSVFLIIFAAEDESNMVNQPFSVDSHELVAEWVGLDATN